MSHKSKIKTINENKDPLVKDKIKGKVKLIYIDPPFATEDEFRNKLGAKAYSDKKQGAEFLEFLRRRLILAKEILAEDGSIGIRLVKDNYLKKLIGKLNKPLVSTSANLSGDKSPMKFSDINQEIINSVDAIAEENHDKISEYSGSSVIRMWNDGRVKVLRE